ncbi:MAG: hypothetical protein CVU51_04435 [Deltaproteobacteria bacterium HGW-Deltaproteobacteria-1]|jgi:hypothetical protein|nr:MAG: hypothetical protein CVU51_04435 [Deltaproteobacteria bacterium HGW-Deltaproteobacteria-1]
MNSRIHEITTTPERRLVTRDLEGYDKEELRHSVPPKGDKKNESLQRWSTESNPANGAKTEANQPEGDTPNGNIKERHE